MSLVATRAPFISRSGFSQRDLGSQRRPSLLWPLATLGVGVGRTHPTPAGWNQAPIWGLPLSDGVSSVTLTAPSLCICPLSWPHLTTGPATPSTRQSRAPAPLGCPSPAAEATDGTPLLPPHTPAPSPEKAALSPGSCLTQGLQNSRTTVK